MARLLCARTSHSVASPAPFSEYKTKLRWPVRVRGFYGATDLRAQPKKKAAQLAALTCGGAAFLPRLANSARAEVKRSQIPGQ